MPPSASLEMSRPGGASGSGGCLGRVRSGVAVIWIASLQIVMSIALLGLFQGYKASFFSEPDAAPTHSLQMYSDPMDIRSPMGASYYVALFQNIGAVFGLAGILSSQRSLIVVYFTYNAAHMVITFHFFVDLCTDTSIRFKGEPGKLIAYERAATALVFFSFLLSIAATVFSTRSVDEIKAKQREEYNRFTVLSDTLQWEADA